MAGNRKRAQKRRRNVKDGAIWFDRYPPHHARHAYDRGFYVEALQVLHGWLESKLQEWLLIGRHGNIRGSYKDVWATAFGIPLLQAAKSLFITGKMSKSTFDQVSRFNSMRNKVIHQMFHESYDKGAMFINMKDYDIAFAIGMKLSEQLELRLAHLATRGKARTDAGAA